MKRPRSTSCTSGLWVWEAVACLGDDASRAELLGEDASEPGGRLSVLLGSRNVSGLVASYGRKRVGRFGVDNNGRSVDGADLALLDVLVVVSDGLELLTGEKVEPVVEDEVAHETPLTAGDHDLDHLAGERLGALDNDITHGVHPLCVLGVVRSVTPVDTVGAVN